MNNSEVTWAELRVVRRSSHATGVDGGHQEENEGGSSGVEDHSAIIQGTHGEADLL